MFSYSNQVLDACNSGAFLCHILEVISQKSVLCTCRVLLDAVIITAAFSKGREAVNDIIEMMNKAVTTMPEKDVQLSEVRGDLELQNIAFNYASNPNGMILRDVSFSIPSGRTVALVGARGSGKSTLISLIERFYDPRSGDTQNLKSHITISDYVLWFALSRRR